jgi:hypothetical protein
MVEDIFRSMKSLLETDPSTTSATRPSGATCSARSWPWCCAKNYKTGWNVRAGGLERADVLRDLDRLQEVELSIGGKSYVMRTETKGTVGKVFPACGVAIPPTLRAADLSRTKEWTVTQDLAQSLARWRKSPPPEAGKTSYS